MKKLRALLIILVLSIFTACLKPETTKIEGVTINGDSLVKVGETINLSAVVEPTGVSYDSVVWKSSDPTVATVSNKGVVKGIKRGEAVITLSVDGKVDTKSISVVIPPSAGAQIPTDTNVISLYNSSNTYPDITGVDWNPYWGQDSSLEDYDTGNGIVKKLNLINYQGVDFNSNRQNITGTTTIHFSYYTNQVTNFDFYPIWESGEGKVSSGDLTADGQWHDLEIDLSQVSEIDLTTIRQLKFEANGSTGIIYFDNIYFK